MNKNSRPRRLLELEAKIGLGFGGKASDDELREYCTLLRQWVESGRPAAGDIVANAVLSGGKLVRGYAVWTATPAENSQAAAA